MTIQVGGGGGSGNGRVLLIGFDHEHPPRSAAAKTAADFDGSHVVRSFRSVGQWAGTPLRLSEPFPEGQDVAVVLEAPDGQIIGASRLAGNSS